jgi:uncharacterized protein
MTIEVAPSQLALGAVTGAVTFLLLTGGRFPCALPRPLGGALVVRWFGLGAAAGLEEVAWRGLVLGGLMAVLEPWAALAASSAMFAIWHWSSLRARSAVHLVTGAAFGGVFLAGGLVAAMLGHALYNLLVDWAVHVERARLRGP